MFLSPFKQLHLFSAVVVRLVSEELLWKMSSLGVVCSVLFVLIDKLRQLKGKGGRELILAHLRASPPVIHVIKTSLTWLYLFIYGFRLVSAQAQIWWDEFPRAGCLQTLEPKRCSCSKNNRRCKNWFGKVSLCQSPEASPEMLPLREKFAL